MINLSAAARISLYEEAVRAPGIGGTWERPAFSLSPAPTLDASRCA
jgi:hypothetical protein